MLTLPLVSEAQHLPARTSRSRISVLRNLGISATTEPSLAKRIGLCNTMALSFVAMCLGYSLVFLALGLGAAISLSLLVVAAAYACVLVLNAMGWDLAGRMLAIAVFNFAVVAYALLFGPEAEMSLILIAAVVLPFLSFRPTERVLLVLTVLMSLGLYLALEALGTRPAMGPALSAEAIGGLRAIMGPTAFLILGLGLTHLYIANERAEADTRASLVRLREETADRLRSEKAADAERARARYARAAGMAEVATGVLHNVGNSLNSINVSHSLLEERVKKSRIGGLRQLSELLEKNATSLPAFLSSDPRGVQALPFLRALCRTLEGEQESLLEELDGLGKNVHHVRSVLSTQQSLARSGGQIELIEPHRVAEESLALYNSSCERHGVRVIAELEQLPAVQIDRHRVIQILLNLVRNGVDAVKGCPAQTRELHVKLFARDGRIVFEVKDSGVGIAPEHRTKIFTHAFTTKADGHGYGLHTSACAASEMGGALGFDSEGAGHGATFRLELPFTTTRAAKAA